jgi:hypothetical protein
MLPARMRQHDPLEFTRKGVHVLDNLAEFLVEV